jgi:integrase
MATPKKLPSGSYRIRVFSHIDENGKKIYKSFTDKNKNVVKKLAREFEDLKDQGIRQDKELTFEEAMKAYFELKENRLSPKTFREYERMAQNNYSSLNCLYVSRITDKDMQFFIAQLEKQKKSPKTIRNAYSLAMAVIKSQVGKNKKFDVELPEKVKLKYHLPSDNQLKMLIENASDQMKICIYLSAVGTLRRSEICGLKYKDILRDMNAIYIHAAIVQDKNNKWVYKPKTKTRDSERRVILPKKIINMLGEGEPEEFIIKMTPGAITSSFCRLRNDVGLQCRFHDLRHYAATIRMYMGIPLKEIQAVGGWSSPEILQEVYLNQIDEKSNEFTKKANSYFEENLLSKPEKISVS